MKKQARKKKPAKMKGKEALKKYPWLAAPDGSNWMDRMEQGWRRAFGAMMAEDVDRALARARGRDRYHVTGIGERYGKLTWHGEGAPAAAAGELDRIAARYARLSMNTCIICGAPDCRPLNTGRACPMCRRCYEDGRSCGVPYQEAVDEEDPGTMAGPSDPPDVQEAAAAVRARMRAATEKARA